MLFALLFAFSAAACAPEGESGSTLVKDWLDGLHSGNAARVEMEVSGEKIYAALADNAAAKEFADRLAKGETTLAFSDFAGAERSPILRRPLRDRMRKAAIPKSGM